MTQKMATILRHMHWVNLYTPLILIIQVVVSNKHQSKSDKVLRQNTNPKWSQTLTMNPLLIYAPRKYEL
jgi:hypothetical protein